MVVAGAEATPVPTRSLTLTLTPPLRRVIHAWMLWLVEMRPSSMLCFGRRRCCVLAVVDAVLWKEAPPVTTATGEGLGGGVLNSCMAVVV